MIDLPSFLGGVAAVDSKSVAVFALSTLFWPLAILIFVAYQLSKKDD